MINSEAFTKRLQQVLDYYSESASSFAEKIGVQRSSISHILSGRNKPSLDFVLKVLSTYPEVELYWLLNGKGNFPSDTSPQDESKKDIKPEEVEPNVPLDQNIKVQTASDKSIERIVVFYKDGSFKSYQN